MFFSRWSLTLALLIAVLFLGTYREAFDTAVAATDEEDKIAYHCSPDGPGQGFEICLISPDGAGFQRLTDDGRLDVTPEIAPDGRHIAWTSNFTELWVMDIDGGNPHRVTDLNAAFTSPTWSPDGEKLAFACNNPSNLTQDGLCTINADGSDFQMVKVIEDLIPPAAPDWSPDGRYLLFEGFQTSVVNEDVMLLDLQTGNVTNVTNTPSSYEHGTWSPDGSKIAFVGSPIPSDNDTLNNLYIINPDGSGRTLLFDPEFGATATNPTWSPDGSQIAFFCDTAPTIGDNEMCIVDASDGTLVRSVKTAGFKLQQGARPDWGLIGGIARGDIDCNGKVDAVDALKLLRNVAGLPVSQSEPCPDIGSGAPNPVGDINCSGVPDAVDALLVLRHVAGLPVSLPEGCPALDS